MPFVSCLALGGGRLPVRGVWRVGLAAAALGILPLASRSLAQDPQAMVSSAPVVLESGSVPSGMPIGMPVTIPGATPYSMPMMGGDVFCGSCYGGHSHCSKPTNGYDNQRGQFIRKWADSPRRPVQFFQGDAWLMRYQGGPSHLIGGERSAPESRQFPLPELSSVLSGGCKWRNPLPLAAACAPG